MLIIFLTVMAMFHLVSLLNVNWKTIIFENLLSKLQTPYFWVSVITALFVCSISVYLYYRYQFDKVKQLQHRQKLARMILQNGWYEKSETQTEGFFKDLPQSKTKEKISYFPKMYYYMKNGLIHIHVEITLSKYQDQLLQLEKKLETGLYCELVDKILKDSYVEYILLYDTIANRIGIDDVIAEGGRLKLMKSLYWEYDTLPHMLIAGGTGGGKTYYILTIIEALLHTTANFYILDPKNSDLADLATIMPNVYYKKEEMLACINCFYDEMIVRSETMKLHPNYKTGENYAYLDLPANFLIFDEYVAFMDMLGRDSVEVISKLKQIVMLGRQAGFFLILACQRPDAKYLGDGIRDQFNFRVALGRMSELGYGMMFGSDVQKQFFLKPIKGRGYVDTGTSVISEFYTPLVPKGYDFLKEMKKLVHKEQADPVTDEVKTTDSD
ncbi:ATP-binding protein [Listeria monocytogenes]|nr:ATP-binding protein [Listeria monocytogenes]EAG8239210.1 ATP-binding protein [Listeria monocytogenes]EAH0155664.1 ATP-binding protein [Listeria monocytogenes]EAH3095593.1 ATP-binding protein [Listeria monocytogenes]EAH4135075.1 ATP-binding protein [Listeria monocytogenes]